jgi:pentatricopeptide repeat protein
MVNDKTKPMLIRILVKNMLWGKGFDIIEKMLDRGIWKAVQKTEIKWDINTSLYSTNEDQRKKIENALWENIT